MLVKGVPVIYLHCHSPIVHAITSLTIFLSGCRIVCNIHSLGLLLRTLSNKLDITVTCGWNIRNINLKVQRSKLYHIYEPHLRFSSTCAWHVNILGVADTNQSKINYGHMPWQPRNSTWASCGAVKTRPGGSTVHSQHALQIYFNTILNKL